jgi:hypothetical protein
MQKIIFILTIILTGIGLSSCYSLRDVTIPPDVKTISIVNVYNETGQGPTNISQNATEKLKAYYQSNTKLILVQSNADWKLEGKIVGYASTGVAAKANETSGSNRLTITIKMNFINTKYPKQNFDQNFSFFQDYDQTKTLFEVESNLTNIILDQIVLDIFQKTTSNW